MKKHEFLNLLNQKHEPRNPILKEEVSTPSKRKLTFKRGLLIFSPIFAATLAAAIIVPIALNASDPLRGHRLNAPQKPFNSESAPAISPKLVNAMQDFAFDYGHQVYSNEDNPVFSPASIVSAFSMLKDGTEGSSKQELEQLFHDGVNKEDIKNLLLADAIDRGEPQTPCYLNLAQSIFLDSTYKDYVKTSYLNLLTEYYFAEGFYGDLSTPEMRDVIAGWVNEKTKDFLNVRADDFKEAPDTTALFWLINTIYLKTGWKAAAKSGLTRTFYNANGTEKPIETFSIEQYVTYTDTPHYIVASAALSYGMRFSLLMPKEGETIEALLQSKDSYEALFNEAADVTFDAATIIMPRFRAHERYDLKEVFEPLGVSDIFDERHANLSGITDGGPNGQNVFITKAIHETGIEVTEKGIEAAAYTATSGGWYSSPDGWKWLYVNRPFLYAVTDKQNVPLFVGVVNNL